MHFLQSSRLYSAGEKNLKCHVFSYYPERFCHSNVFVVVLFLVINLCQRRSNQAVFHIHVVVYLSPCREVFSETNLVVAYFVTALFAQCLLRVFGGIDALPVSYED